MNVRRIVVIPLLAAGLALVASEARAGLEFYTTKSSFEARGVIQKSYDFNALGPNTAIIGSGTTLGGVTFNISPYGVVLGTNDTSHPTSHNVVVSPFWSSVIMDVESSPTHNMFGMSYGTALGAGVVQMAIFTNLTTYAINIPGSYIGTALLFGGFVVNTPGEYITQVQGYSSPSFGGGFGVGTFELGQAQVVPEPGTIGMAAAAGVLSLLKFRRRLGRRSA